MKLIRESNFFYKLKLDDTIIEYNALGILKIISALFKINDHFTLPLNSIIDYKITKNIVGYRLALYIYQPSNRRDPKQLTYDRIDNVFLLKKTTVASLKSIFINNIRITKMNKNIMLMNEPLNNIMNFYNKSYSPTKITRNMDEELKILLLETSV